MSSAERNVATDETTRGKVRAELQKITGSQAFERSPQLQRFLRYLVEETLAGRGPRLKEYVIGTEVFGRPPDYDPQLDSLVRVEAHRLRALLEQYYDANTPQNGVRIEIKKGSYIPVFRDTLETVADETGAAKPSRVHWWFALAGAAAILAAVGWWGYRSYLHRGGGAVREQTVAVLPFDNFSSEPGAEYFCYGLMDEISAEVAKNQKLRVVAQTSASRFKRGDDIASIGRQLSADAVLEGSVQRSGDRVRVNAQLIRVSDRLQVWSQSFERPAVDLFVAQDEIAQAVSTAVQAHLTGRAADAGRPMPYSTSADANQLYWKGIYFRAPVGRTGWRKDLAVSAEFLERATEKDPRFAKAYAVLADVYVNLGWERAGGPVTQGYMERGRKAANRALELEDDLAEAYGALGTIQFFYDYDKAAAEKSFQRALQLDPSNGRARMWYAMALTMQGRGKEAIEQATKARDLDPLSYVSTTHLAVAYYFSRNNDEAIRLTRELLAIADIAPAHGLLGMAYEVQHKYDAAIAEYQAGLRLVPKHPYIKAMMAHAYASSGRREEAMKWLKDANLPYDEGGLSDLKVSYTYVALGEYDEAFRHLERDLEQRDPELVYINADPVFDPVRKDPRFVAILRAMDLAK